MSSLSSPKHFTHLPWPHRSENPPARPIEIGRSVHKEADHAWFPSSYLDNPWRHWHWKHPLPAGPVGSIYLLQFITSAMALCQKGRFWRQSVVPVNTHWTDQEGLQIMTDLLVSTPWDWRQFRCRVHSCGLSLIHIWRCRRSTLCRSRWSPYH